MSPNFDHPFKYDNHPSGPALRPTTPSADNRGGLVASVFSSKTDRFAYTGRMKVEVQHQPPASDPPPSVGKSKSARSQSLASSKADLRSESVTGMTFARAMGLDRSKHVPKKQDRAIFHPPLLDFAPYDWRAHDKLRVERLGFALDRASRAPPDAPFRGSVWRGCASLSPDGGLATPSAYDPPPLPQGWPPRRRPRRRRGQRRPVPALRVVPALLHRVPPSRSQRPSLRHR